MRHLIAVIFFFLVLSPLPTRAANPADFLVFSKADLPGRLYVPSTYTPEQSYPLVLFLHGAGEAGSNNTAQVNANIDGLLAAAKSRNFFLYAPQSPSTAWGSSSLTPTAQIAGAVSMLSTAQSTYSIHPNRIYITGLSAGGGGTWDALASYPTLFAAGAPICGTLGTSAFQPPLAHQSIFAFHARNDTVVAVNTTRNMVNAILTADGLPTLTFPSTSDPNDAYYNLDDGRLQYYEFAAGGHGIWHAVYNAPPFYDWLLAQSLPEPSVSLVAIAAMMILGRRRQVR